ncbi:MAG: RNA 3'-terminal phosphate cyclase [Desulfobacterales bacterium]|nr:RNA 3'-terminal phosphate cyclase [Desulfobacterales bacterium]
MVIVDGSAGEGGGQILRTSIALSLCLGIPFHIINIRAHRKKPGLRRQHLMCVNAAAQIGKAKVKGAKLGNQELTFIPAAITPGDYHFDIGTAGSTTLVLQTILPALIIAKGPSTLILEGGTHNPFAPPFDFIQQAFIPIINSMGPKINARLERPGYYPKGGGRFNVTIQPADQLRTFHINKRGEINECHAKAVVAGLPRHIAERELGVIEQKLGWNKECFRIIEQPADMGPGNIVCIEIKSKHITEIFTGFGKKGVRAEDVAKIAVNTAIRYLEAGVPVGKYLADQLLLPLALAGGGSYTTLKPSLHTKSNSDVIKLFLDINININQTSNDVWSISA